MTPRRWPVLLPLLASCVLGVGLRAQSVIVPSDATVGPPAPWGPFSANVFYSSPLLGQKPDSRTQLIYATSDIPAPVAVWGSVAFRRPCKNRVTTLINVNPAMTTNAVIQMSVSPRLWTDTNTSFAANHGPNLVTVFSGMLSLPMQPPQQVWPCPWEAPVVFGAPFAYAAAAGNTLVVDILQAGNTGTSWWLLEAYNRDFGHSVPNGPAQPNCKFGNGSLISFSVSYLPFLGGSWYTSYGGPIPANLPAVGALGSQGAGGSWGPIPLPFDLTALGAPNCLLLVEALVTVPLAITGASSNTYLYPSIPVPQNPALVGTRFFDQPLFLDPLANAWGVVTGPSMTWIVGSGNGALAREVSAVGNNAGAATGSDKSGLGVALRLQ